MASVVALLFAPGCGPSDDTGPTGDPKPSQVATKAREPDAAEQDPEKLYLAVKQKVELSTGPLSGAQVDELTQDLRIVAEKTNDAHLRANASLLAGSLLEESGNRPAAISFFRQARAAVPDEASTHAMLALALAAEKQYAEAAEVQQEVVKLAPDDLQGWLLLGEINVKGGQEKEAKAAYAGYEMRRKGLIDGLTLKEDGAYIVGPGDRAGCAAALEPAADNGTALALLYALGSEPETSVRLEIARVMGTQRLEGYKVGLQAQLEKEADRELKDAITWALAEISRDPVDTRPGPSPAEAEGAEPEAPAPEQKDGAPKPE